MFYFIFWVVGSILTFAFRLPTWIMLLAIIVPFSVVVLGTVVILAILRPQRR